MSYVVSTGEFRWLESFDAPWAYADSIETAKRWKTRQGAQNAITACKRSAPNLPYEIQEVADVVEKPDPWKLVRKETHRGRPVSIGDSKQRRSM